MYQVQTGNKDRSCAKTQARLLNPLAGLSRLAGKFKQDRRGNIAMVFAASMLPVIGTIGAAVDYGMAVSEKSRLQAVVDSAVLAAGRAYQIDGNDTAAGDAGYDVVQSAIGTGTTLGAVMFARTDVVVDTQESTVSISARSRISTSFLSVMHINYIDVEAFAQSGLARGGIDQNLEVSMMLDVTGSMGGTKLDDLKVAAKDLINIVLQGAAGSEDKTAKVALVPFAQAVNVGPYFTAVTGVENGTNEYNYPPECYNKKGKLKKSCKDDPQYFSAQYAVCVTERVANRFHDHSPATGNGNKFPLYDNERSNASHVANSSCKPKDASIIPLTDDKTTLFDSIDAMVADGYTAGHLGTAWAWYMLSPNWADIWPADSTPAAYDPEETMKIAILMTDGEYNTYYKSQNGNSNVQARALCDNMKTEGIIIYTVGFELDSQSAIDTLKHCATDETTHYFSAENGVQLKMAFREIAFKLAQLRLTK